MILRLERRSQRSTLMALLSPVLAIAVTLALGAIMFAALGFDPAEALYMYFVEPLTSVWSVEEVIVKAAPLIIIGVGLAVCYTANVWNIGAEGQLTIGALLGAAIPIYFPDWQSPLVLALMLVLGAAGGALFAAIPAFLKNHFSANEILTSLMLVYVAQLLLDWLVRGPWRDPDGYNFPQSIPFEGWQLLPLLGEGRVHIGAVFAVAAVIVVAFMMGRTLRGFEIRVVGTSPRAAAFAGFRGKRVILFCFMLSGALAGLAGICEVAGPNGELQPNISPGYGFTRDHRRLSRSPEPNWRALRGRPSGHQLYGRRGGAGGARHLRQDDSGVPGHAAVPHPGLRHADPLPHKARSQLEDDQGGLGSDRWEPWKPSF